MISDVVPPGSCGLVNGCMNRHQSRTQPTREAMEVLYVEPGKEEEKAAQWTQISQRHRASTVVPPRNTGHRIFAQSLKVDRLSRKAAVNSVEIPCRRGAKSAALAVRAQGRGRPEQKTGWRTRRPRRRACSSCPGSAG